MDIHLPSNIVHCELTAVLLNISIMSSNPGRTKSRGSYLLHAFVPLDLLIMYSASEVYPDVPVPGATRVDLPNRDDCMPTFWRIDRHPSISADARVDGCLIFWQDTDESLMGALRSYLNSVEIPEGSRKGMQSAGTWFLLYLSPPTILNVRIWLD